MIHKVKGLLEKKDTKTLVLLLIMGLILSIIEVIGIASIMPFITMASNPDIILDNRYLLFLYNLFHFTSTIEFTIYFGIVLVSFFIFRAIYTMLYTFLLNKFTLNKYKSLVNIIFNNYLNLSYEKFVKKNSSNMLKVIITEAGQLSALTINIMAFISEIVIILVLYILLLLVDIKMTLILTILLGGKVLLLSKTISSKIKSKGIKRAKVEESFYKLINESLSNFKLIKFVSEQNKLSDKFYKLSNNFSTIYIYNNTMQIFPRIILEAFGFSLLMSAVIYILISNDNNSNLISIISMYALALYRILPAITKILNSYNNIMFHSKSLDIVYDAIYESSILEGTNKLKFSNNIRLQKINFNYDNNIKVIKNINLEIKKGKKIAFIGESGSGKSTLVDLICGIYEPNSGKIYIDDIELTNDNIVSWRKKIGYIPQSIYLYDGTIADNISFGRDYDEQKIINVLRQANIYDTLLQKDGLNTMVGEGGIQLSGGQKQRIGIARALYGDPEILVLDEATSALDTNTEQAIMDEIYKISENKTLLIIAHRLSTIEKCDRKINMETINDK